MNGRQRAAKRFLFLNQPLVNYVVPVLNKIYPYNGSRLRYNNDWHINYPVHPHNKGLCTRPGSGDSIAKSAYNKNLLH